MANRYEQAGRQSFGFLHDAATLSRLIKIYDSIQFNDLLQPADSIAIIMRDTILALLEASCRSKPTTRTDAILLKTE